MESRLSSIYNRLRRTLRRRTGEVQYRSQQPETESRPGRDSQQTMIIQEGHLAMKREAEREMRRRRAKEILRWMDDLDDKREETNKKLKKIPMTLIGKAEMVRILLLTVQLSGELPSLDFLDLERRDILEPQEIQYLKEALETTRSAMMTFEPY
ncbi:accessory protein [Denotus virus]|nr:accessory protein [Denotus virus]